MGIDLKKLEKVKRIGLNTIARCPACAENGGDRKGEHLIINDRGQFGCVLYPGEPGQPHRQRIFELVGLKEKQDISFEIRIPSSTPPENMVIQKDILGTLGAHLFKTRAKESEADDRVNNIDKQENSKETVPSVPEPDAG
jgi:hypothetical protein